MIGITSKVVRHIVFCMPFLTLLPVSALLFWQHRENASIEIRDSQQLLALTNALRNDVSWIDYTSPGESATNLKTFMSNNPYVLGVTITYNNGISSTYGSLENGRQSALSINGENVDKITFNFSYDSISSNSQYLAYLTAASIVVLLIGNAYALRIMLRRLNQITTELRLSERGNLQLVEASERDRAFRWVSLQTVIDIIKPGLFNTGILLEMLERINTQNHIYQKPATFSPGQLIEQIAEEYCSTFGRVVNHGCTNGYPDNLITALAYPSYFGNVISLLLTLAKSNGSEEISIEHTYHTDANGIGNLVTRISSRNVGLSPERLQTIRRIFEGTIDSVPSRNIEFLVAYRCVRMMDGTIFVNANPLDWTEYTVQIPVSISTNASIQPKNIFPFHEGFRPVPARLYFGGLVSDSLISQLELMGIRITCDDILNIRAHLLEQYDIVLIHRPTQHENAFLNEYFANHEPYNHDSRRFTVLCAGNVSNQIINYTSAEYILGTCLEGRIIETIHSHLKAKETIKQLRDGKFTVLERL